MKFVVFGLNHWNTPVQRRELFALSSQEVVTLLQNWIHRFPAAELVPLSTCNRTEFYIATENGTLPDMEEVFAFVCENKVHDENELASLHDCRENFFLYDDAEALDHLFKVISSLDSMVPGEPQILSQVKAAYQLAADEGTTGPATHAAFQAALRTAKRITTETQLFHHRVSIPSVAVVDFALGLFEKLADKKTVILGAGEMARETLRYLTDNGARMIEVVNRSLEHAQQLAKEFNGTVGDWEHRELSLEQADIIVAATSADHYVFTPEQYRKASMLRRGRPMFMLDLAVPRNIDPAFARFPEVYLYSIDDLQAACGRNRAARDREIPRADKIVKQETALFLQEMRRRDSGDLIRQLRLAWNTVKEEELKRLFNKCPDLDEKMASEIQYAFDRIVNKLLHPPMESLKDESVSGTPNKLMEAMKRLFRL